jgi:V/A-type H+-transporting ATPase subunit I
MFFPERMEKVSILVLGRDRDRVVDKLKKLGNSHVIESPYKADSKDLSDIRDSISRTDKLLEILGRFEGKPGLKELLGKDSVVGDVDATALKVGKRVIELDRKLAELEEMEKEIRAELEVIEKVEGLAIPFLDTKNLGIAVGEFDAGKFGEMERGMPKTSDIVGKRAGKQTVVAVIAYLKSEQEDVFNVLNKYGFRELKIKLNVKPKTLETELKRIEAEKRKAGEELKRISKGFKRKLEALRRKLVAEKEEKEIVEGFEGSRHTYLIQTWIPSEDVERTSEIVSKDVKCFISSEKPSEKDRVPVLLKNPGFVKPFEFMTKLYGVPNYKEVDPTPVLAFTFPLIFGAMFGDVGHGLLLSAFALLMRYVSKNKGTRSMLDFSDIILACGLASILFGFLYGSIFGYEDVLSAVFIKPSESAVEMMGIAMFVGIMHMAIGMGINFFNGKGLLYISLSVLKVWFFFGEVVIMTKLFNLPIPVLEWFTGVPFLTTAVFGVGVPAVLILTLHMVEKGFKEIGSTLGNSLFEIFELLTKFLSNIISYSRIFALALVHAALFAAIFLIAEMMHPYEIVVLVFGTLGAVSLEVLIVFIHSLRLHFYEWFDKFFMNGGEEFRPFGSSRGGD